MVKLEYQKELENKKVQFQYKQSNRSKKWVNGFVNLCYTKIAYQYGIDLQKQENFYTIRFIII